jgi:hypothetical protein
VLLRFCCCLFSQRCSADRDVFAFDWLGMGASARPTFDAADQDAAEAFFLQAR